MTKRVKGVEVVSGKDGTASYKCQFGRSGGVEDSLFQSSQPKGERVYRYGEQPISYGGVDQYGRPLKK